MNPIETMIMNITALISMKNTFMSQSVTILYIPNKTKNLGVTFRIKTFDMARLKNCIMAGSAYAMPLCHSSRRQ